MLRVVFELVEKSLGGSLEGAAAFLWGLGLALVALQVLAPFGRIAVEAWRWRAGLEPAWLIHCGACSAHVPVDETCVKCGAKLSVPALAKLFARRLQPRPAVQRTGWALSMLGALVFLAGSLSLVSELSPTGSMERLFAGASLITWAGAGAFLAKALGPRGGGPIARARELFFALAALVLLSGFFFLEQNVRVLPERVLGHVIASAGQVELDGAKLQLSGPELGLELQIVEGLGMSRVLPLAWVGATRSPIELGTADAWLRDNSWKHASTLRDAGVQVKRRTETFPLSPGDKYEVVLRERDVQLKSVK